MTFAVVWAYHKSISLERKPLLARLEVLAKTLLSSYAERNSYRNVRLFYLFVK